MCACFLSLSSSLRCKLKKLNHRARPLQARATPDDEGQGEGKGSHDGSPRQVDDERLTLSHLNQLSRRLDRRGGHSFRNHASHGGAQRELSGHKARFLVSFKSSKRKRARAYKHPSPPSDASRASTVNNTRHRTSPHRTGSHIDASATPYAWKSRPACATLSTPQPRYDPTPAIDAAAPRARKAIAHRAHKRTHIIHMHRSRAVCDTPTRECATTPLSLARDRFAIPKPHPRASSRARIAPSRDVPHRPRAHRRDARVSHASAPRAIAAQRRARRPRRRARRDGVLSSPRDSGHRSASHRIVNTRTLSARRTAAAGLTTLAEDFFAVVARACATVGRVVEAVTANMMCVVVYRCVGPALGHVSLDDVYVFFTNIRLNLSQYVVEPDRGWFWGLAINIL